MVFALIITSCNKYANDFQQLKDQIAALSLKVDGVAALQTQLTATTAQITALQAAVAALPQVSTITGLQTALNTANTNIASIQTALNTLATNGATAASVAALAKQLGDIQTAMTANDLVYKQKFTDLQTALNAAATSAQLAKAQSDLLAAISANAMTTNDSIAAMEASIKASIAAGLSTTNGKIDALAKLVSDANAATAASIVTILGKLTTAQTTADATNTSVQALVIAMNKAQSDLTTLLNATAMYNDNVTITTDAEVDFYLAKLYQMGIINGNVTVNTTAISANRIDTVSTILNAIVGVIGTNVSTQVIFGGNHHWGGTWTITTVPGSGHSVNIESSATDHLSAAKLFSIRGDYSVSGSDIADPMIDNVGGTVTLDYPGSYMSTSLKTVGADLVLVNYNTKTLDINIPNVSIGGNIGDGTHTPDGIVNFSALKTTTPVFAGTNSITLGLLSGGIKSLTANNATIISIGTGSIAAAGLAITAPIATSVTLLATASAGPVVIETGVDATHGTATTVDLKSLVTSGNLTVWAAAAGTVKLDALNTVKHVDIEGPLTLSIPVWQGNPGAHLTAPQTTTLTLASYRWWSVTDLTTIPTTADLLVIKNLTLGNALENVNIGAYPTLLTASVTGAAFTDATHLATAWATIDTWHKPMVSTTGNANLTTLWVGGVLNTVNVSTLPKLTSFTTAGVINTLILDNAAILTSATLGHSAFVGLPGTGGPGSDLWITNNAKLASVAPTALDWLHTLKVTGNGSLAMFDFTSYKQVLASSDYVWVSIDAPADITTYTASIKSTGAGNPAKQAIIVNADISKFKPYLLLCDNNSTVLKHVTTNAFNINTGVTGSTLAAKMATDAASWTTAYGYTNLVTATALSALIPLPATAALNTVDELSIVQ